MTTYPLRPNVCMLLVQQAGKLFLGERFGDPGIWQFPQGGVEPDAPVEESVLRELEEELGVQRQNLRIVKKLATTHQYEWEEPRTYRLGTFRGQAQTFWLVAFLGHDTDISVAVPHPEFRDWRWCTIDEIRRAADPVRLPGYEPALREVEEWLGVLLTNAGVKKEHKA